MGKYRFLELRASLSKLMIYLLFENLSCIRIPTEIGWEMKSIPHEEALHPDIKLQR
jgi:hypothetical protein